MTLNKMTLLRRTAQLIQDLRTIGVISTEDRIYTKESDTPTTDVFTLTIELRGSVTWNDNWRERRSLIESCISEEFSKDEYRVEDSPFFGVSIIFKKLQ